jgi:hypothetical protein
VCCVYYLWQLSNTYFVSFYLCCVTHCILYCLICCIFSITSLSNLFFKWLIQWWLLFELTMLHLSSRLFFCIKELCFSFNLIFVCTVVRIAICCDHRYPYVSLKSILHVRVSRHYLAICEYYLKSIYTYAIILNIVSRIKNYS